MANSKAFLIARTINYMVLRNIRDGKSIFSDIYCVTLEACPHSEIVYDESRQFPDPVRLEQIKDNALRNFGIVCDIEPGVACFYVSVRSKRVTRPDNAWLQRKSLDIKE